MSEEELKQKQEDDDEDEKYRATGYPESSNALIWTGFALTNFILVITLVPAILPKDYNYTYFGIKTLDLVGAFFISSGTLFAITWALHETVGSFEEFKSKIKRKKLTNQARLIKLIGTMMWSIGIVILTFALNMILTTVIFIIFAIFAYTYLIPIYYFSRDWKWWRYKKKEKKEKLQKEEVKPNEQSP